MNGARTDANGSRTDANGAREIDEARRVAHLLGIEAEALVADLLEREGWSVLACNWRGGGGELDLVVIRDGVLRFVEVKARAPDDPNALEAIGTLKQRRLRSAAEAWLVIDGPPEREVAFLVAVVTTGDRPWTVLWLDDAF